MYQLSQFTPTRNETGTELTTRLLQLRGVVQLRQWREDNKGLGRAEDYADSARAEALRDYPNFVEDDLAWRLAWEHSDNLSLLSADDQSLLRRLKSPDGGANEHTGSWIAPGNGGLR